MTNAEKNVDQVWIEEGAPICLSTDVYYRLAAEGKILTWTPKRIDPERSLESRPWDES